MKKLCALSLCICLLLAAGCSADPVAQPSTPIPASTADNNVVIVAPTEPITITPPTVHPMHAVIMPPVQETTIDEDGTLIFTKSYQNFRLIFNGSDVGNIIGTDLQTRMNTFLSAAANIESYAKTDYVGQEGWAPYYVSVSYTPTRIDHHVLSLYGQHSSYSGETHPSSGTESVTYDLSTGSALTLGDILVPGYSGEKMASLVCQALTDWAGELYSDYETVITDQFTHNADSIASWYFTRTGLTFHFSPSEIAPTFVGIVTAQIPYDSLTELLREEYIPSPAATSGSIYAEEFIADDSERFTRIVNVELDAAGKKILLYPDAPVADLRLEVGSQMADGSGYTTQTTVFCADAAALGEAIVVHADLSDPTRVLQLHYRSGTQEVSAFIFYDAEGDSIVLAHG